MSKKSDSDKTHARVPSGATVSHMAIKLEQNGHSIYVTTIPIDDLFPCCYVLRRDEDPVDGFQRHLTEKRADNIAAYVEMKFIPSAIVLAAQPEANLQYNRQNKSIAFNQVPGAFLAIDGQHRLAGFERCTKCHRVLVAICDGLSEQEEVQLFVDINTNQKGVPPALLEDIKKLTGGETPEEALCRQFFDQLNQDDKSPLKEKLSAAKSGTGKISRVTFNRSVKPVLASEALADLPYDKQYQLLLNYLMAFHEALRDKEVMTKVFFFFAMFDVFDDVVNKTMSTRKSVKLESLLEIIRKIANHQVMQNSKRQPKFGLAQSMRKILNSDTKVSEDDL